MTMPIRMARASRGSAAIMLRNQPVLRVIPIMSRRSRLRITTPHAMPTMMLASNEICMAVVNANAAEIAATPAVVRSTPPVAT